MKTAGHLVGAVFKLAAGVQDGHDHFGRRFFHLLVPVYRDAAPVILYHDAVIEPDRYRDPVTEPTHGLVDAVIHNLVHQVV